MKKNALVIDDEQVVLDSVRRILEPEGYNVHTTTSGKDGIRIAAETPFDIVLTDIRMPFIDGFKVLRDIKRSNPGIPIVVITGYATVQSAVEAIQLGATNYIEKPFTPEQLLHVVDAALTSALQDDYEEPTLIHKREVMKILKKGASDSEFANRLFADGESMLKRYNLTSHEKLAILTADLDWIEDHIGIVKETVKKWLVEAVH